MRSALVFSLGLLLGPVNAQVPDRLLGRDAARYLDLSAEQVKMLTQSQAAWRTYRAEAASRATRLEAEVNALGRLANPAQAKLDKQRAELDDLCRESTARQQRTTTDVRNLLTPTQLGKLATLEQALTLMPIVESAQSINLLFGDLSAAPAGMPGGSVEDRFSYVRSAVPPLPGCRPARQVVHREVDRAAPKK
ncbi:MAG: hypothetical protein ABL931_02145 [Usitatibacteraceae bacterium]